MTEEQKTKIKQLWDQAAAAKGELNLERLSMHLGRYQEFVIGMKNSIAGIRDYDSFREFRARWKECGGIAMLPKELTAFNRYLSLANTYNAELIPELLNGGKVLEFVPVMFSQEELDIIQNAADVYRRPFVWDKIKNRLVGEAAHRAVYMHAAAVLEPENFCQMIDDGSIRMETLEHLPYVAGLHDVGGNGENDRQLQQAYAKNLAAIYRHYGKQLPEPVTEEVRVCGVSFENRPQKLNYLLRWARDLCHTSEEKIIRGDGAADINQKLVIELEKYVFHNQQEGVDEPAVRVLASIQGEPEFIRMDIGNLPKEISARIDKETPDASLSAELDEIGIAPVPGRSGTETRIYVKLALTIGGGPRELARTSDRNRGAEADDLLNDELR